MHHFVDGGRGGQGIFSSCSCFRADINTQIWGLNIKHSSIFVTNMWCKFYTEVYCQHWNRNRIRRNKCSHWTPIHIKSSWPASHLSTICTTSHVHRLEILHWKKYCEYWNRNKAECSHWTPIHIKSCPDKMKHGSAISIATQDIARWVIPWISSGWLIDVYIRKSVQIFHKASSDKTEQCEIRTWD